MVAKKTAVQQSASGRSTQASGGAAKGDLIADLKEITGSLSAFAKETPHGQTHVLGGAEDAFNLTGQFQAR